MILGVLKRLALLALLAAGLAAAAAAVFLLHPELVLTDRVVAAAVKRFGAAYSPRWSRLSFSASSAGRLRHRYALSADDACASGPAGEFKACFKRLEASVLVRYSRRGVRVEVVENLAALGGDLEADLRGGGGRRRAVFAPPFVRKAALELPRLVLRADGLRASGRLFASASPGARRAAALSADLKTSGPKGVGRVRAELSADTDLFNGGRPSFVDAAGSVEASRLGRARLSVQAVKGRRGYVVTGAAEVRPSTGAVGVARLSRCRGAADLDSPLPPSGRLSCRYEVAPSTPAVTRFGEFKRATGEVSLDAQLQGRRLTAGVKGTVDPLGAWYELSGDAEARLEGELGGPLSSMTLTHAARAKLAVPRFEDLVEFLRETRWSVPAPFHVLKGPLTLSVESRGSPGGDRQTLRYALASDLSGARQRFKARASGRLTVVRPRGPGRSYEHAGEVLLQEVAVELPRLEAGPAPKIALDRRIRSGEAPEAAASSSTAAAAAPAAPLPLVSRVTVRTEKPLTLFSNLAKQPVPASLDLLAAYPPSSVGGSISVKRFDIELFRRAATVDHVDIALSTASTTIGLDGLVLYETPSASIRISVLGTTERPRIELSSVPPMKREDIIGLLIFGKNPDELDPEQTASVSNTETALESRAFGLASLYLFGATPIEHVGYDSATKTTTVKLRLPGGANLTLGSDFDQSRQLSVRKSLSPHWSIHSEVTEQGQQSKAATTFLEWLNRY